MTGKRNDFVHLILTGFSIHQFLWICFKQTKFSWPSYIDVVSMKLLMFYWDKKLSFFIDIVRRFLVIYICDWQSIISFNVVYLVGKINEKWQPLDAVFFTAHFIGTLWREKWYIYIYYNIMYYDHILRLQDSSLFCKRVFTNHSFCDVK